MDLPDIRASLAEQNWVMRIGKGSHGVWYPPDRSKRPVSIPMNGKAPTNEAGRAGLRATLRRSGWIDPEFANRKPLPRARSTETDTEADAEPLASEPASTSATTLLNPSSTPESTDMSSTTDSTTADEPTVVEEAWAHNAGGVSTSIKEQLLSDGSVRYRCAHPLGGGCSFTHLTQQGIMGHQKAHRYPARPQAAHAAPTEPSWRQDVAQRRAAQAQHMVADQTRDMIAEARDSGQAVRRFALITAGMGAGHPTDTVHVVATPSGDVTFECATPGCDYSADRYGQVFAHRSKVHSKRRGPSAGHSDIVAATDRQDPATQITANGSRADLSVHAPALPVTVARPATTIGVEPTSTELEPTVMTAAEATAEAIVEQEPSAATTAPAARTPAPRPGGSPFQEAVEYLREQCTQMVDHLRDMAEAVYVHNAALREQDVDIERLETQLAAALQTRDILQAEVDELRAEQKELVAARDQLAQLRSMFRTLGMAD